MYTIRWPRQTPDPSLHPICEDFIITVPIRHLCVSVKKLWQNFETETMLQLSDILFIRRAARRSERTWGFSQISRPTGISEIFLGSFDIGISKPKSGRRHENFSTLYLVYLYGNWTYPHDLELCLRNSTEKAELLSFIFSQLLSEILYATK